MTDDAGMLKQVLEWGTAVVGVLVGIVYKKHEADIMDLKAGLGTKVSMSDYQALNAGHETARREMREAVIKIFDKLEQHSRDTQTKFDQLMQMVHNQNLSILSEVNKKADK